MRKLFICNTEYIYGKGRIERTESWEGSFLGSGAEPSGNTTELVIHAWLHFRTAVGQGGLCSLPFSLFFEQECLQLSYTCPLLHATGGGGDILLVHRSSEGKQGCSWSCTQQPDHI